MITAWKWRRPVKYFQPSVFPLICRDSHCMETATIRITGLTKPDATDTYLCESHAYRQFSRYRRRPWIKIVYSLKLQ